MAELLFTFGKREGKQGEEFLVLVEEKGKRRLIYVSDIQEMHKTLPDLSSLLLQEIKRSSKGFSITSDATAIPIHPNNISRIIQELTRSKKCLWKGLSIFYNPLNETKIQVTGEDKGKGGLLLTAEVVFLDQFVPLSAADFFCLTKEGAVVIYKQIVLFLGKENFPPAFSGIYPDGKLLEGKKRDQFIEDYKEDPPENFPKIIWRGGGVATEKIESPLPVLQLKDYYGALADLFMDYGGKKVLFSGLEEEKSWEKDLLEVGFIKKPTIDSLYYCPLDKVFSAISLLLDIGWDVFDKEGKRVYRLKGIGLEAKKEQDNITLSGSFAYGEHEVSLERVQKALEDKKPFFSLADGSVGILGGDDFEEVKELLFAAKEASLRKNQFGLLEPFLEKNWITLDPGLAKLHRQRGIYEKEDLFQGTLHPYQEEGKNWLIFLHENKFSGLLADEMGLGKTVQTLAFLANYTFPFPVLIVAPTSLIFNWRREWEKFIPHKKLTLYMGSDRTLPEEGAVLTTYGYLRQNKELFAEKFFSLIILDEAQGIKNEGSQIAKAACLLQGNMKICLTGTPVENKPDDLWSLFHFLAPDLVGAKRDFLASISRKKYWQKILAPFILRRKKEEVAKDLPEKIEQTVFVEMTQPQQRLYFTWLKKAQEGVLQKVSLEGIKSHQMEILEILLRLRQICCHPHLVDAEVEGIGGKMEQLLEDIAEVVTGGRKVIVYSQFTQFLGLLQKELVLRGFSYVYLDGKTKEREQVVTAFQEDESVQIFLLSLKAGGVGLNLTAADYVFLCDPWWNEAVERQAIDRVHRLGRKNSVIAKRYVTAMSIEENIMDLKQRKALVAEGLLDFEGEVPSFEDILDLFTHQSDAPLAQ